MTPGQYDKVASIIGGYGRQLPEWEELRDADQATLGALRLEAPSTLTVATPRGADVLAASEWDRLNGGGLLASDNNGNLVAEYAPGGWHGVVKDSARAPSGPGSTEALLGEIEEAASGEDTAVERLEAVREILRRWRKAGK